MVLKVTAGAILVMLGTVVTFLAIVAIIDPAGSEMGGVPPTLALSGAALLAGLASLVGGALLFRSASRIRARR